MDSQRKLATIFFCDIEGYSSVMEKDEELGLIRLRRYRKALTDSTTDYHGEIVKNYGDGSLCIFNSVLDAVRCAQNLQSELKKDPVVPIRIGIDIGDIVIDDHDVFGNGINVASRLEQIGEAGAILFSSKVKSELVNHPEFKMVSIGHFILKNMDECMEVFALKNDGLTIPGISKVNQKLKGANKSYRKGISMWNRLAGSLLSLILVIGMILGMIVLSAQKNRPAPVMNSAGSGFALIEYKNKNTYPVFNDSYYPINKVPEPGIRAVKTSYYD